jgi:hypothetical protein
MTLKAKIVSVLALCTLSFAAGRYLQPPAKTVDSTKQTEKQKETKKHTVIVKDKDGKETTTVDEETKTDTKKTDDKHVEVAARKTLNVSALVGYNVQRGAQVYGVGINKEVLGPVSVGAWGLSDGTIGVSAGMSF